MLKETRQFFASLIANNEGVKNLIHADYAMLNNRLAEHYGIEGVVGPEIRRVPLPADSVRGGILSQASILKVSANGTNTSPVVRGVWVMERILGNSPPPPPPGDPGRRTRCSRRVDSTRTPEPTSQDGKLPRLSHDD